MCVCFSHYLLVFALSWFGVCLFCAALPAFLLPVTMFLFVFASVWLFAVVERSFLRCLTVFVVLFAYY